MAGIYVHIPFCKQACYYCNFHFSTNLGLKEKLVNAIGKEIILNKDYLSGETIETIYFGGGTPSLLSIRELSFIINLIIKNFTIARNIEITLEINPDDASKQSLHDYFEVGINRLSIGIQTFNDEFLKYLNRVHDSKKALFSVQLAQQCKFENISIDLIYGIPYDNHTRWINDLTIAKTLNIQHISSYCLTIEPGTVFGKWEKAGKIKVATESFSAEQYELLCNTLESYSFVQYEISNFAKNNFVSRHNSNYWNNTFYLGIGPGAHSYNGSIRRFNVYNNKNYVELIEKGLKTFEEEVLSVTDLANEYLLTSIRTKEGCNINKLLSYPVFEHDKVMNIIDNLVLEGVAIFKNGFLILTFKGKLLADEVTSLLFINK